jgi:DNA-binding LytR/AlgR family response regulator
MMTTLPNVLIIDTDREAAEELTRLLQAEGLARVRAMASTVAGAVECLALTGEGRIDCLFIRIAQWDDFLEHRVSFPREPLTVVFLSGESQRCTRHLAAEVDFHLQPPYSISRLTAIFNRRMKPDFQPRTLHFFFLKVLCRYHAIPFSQLREVRAHGRLITIQTVDAEYTVPGSLTQFQHRLRVPSELVRRGVLVIYHG